jgi:hypothetical protein
MIPILLEAAEAAAAAFAEASWGLLEGVFVTD